MFGCENGGIQREEFEVRKSGHWLVVLGLEDGTYDHLVEPQNSLLYIFQFSIYYNYE